MTTMTEPRVRWGFPAPDEGGYAWPATITQVGALHREFARLGFMVADREERLDLAAELLGLDGLGSFRELTLGKAGWLLSHVSRCGTLAELEEAAAAALVPQEPGRQDGPSGACTLAQLIAVIATEWRRAEQRGRDGGLAARCWPLAGEWSLTRVPGTPDAPGAQEAAEARVPGPGFNLGS